MYIKIIILFIIHLIFFIYIIKQRKEILFCRKMLSGEKFKVNKYKRMKSKIDKLRKEIPGKNLIRKEIVEEIDKILGEVEGI